jgi:hypothetical protein
MEISFARWNRLQTATPWFRKGEGTETAARTTCQDKTTVALPIPRSGLVQYLKCAAAHLRYTGEIPLDKVQEAFSRMELENMEVIGKRHAVLAVA